MKSDIFARLNTINATLQKHETLYDFLIKNNNKQDKEKIEEETTQAVMQYLSKTYKGYIALQPSKHFGKRLVSPFFIYDADDMPIKPTDITELDGILILTTNLADASNPIMNKFYKVASLVNTKNEQYAARKAERKLVVVESKYSVTEDDVAKKLKQVASLQTFLAEARAYYNLSEKFHAADDDVKRSMRKIKQLRRTCENMQELQRKHVEMVAERDDLRKELNSTVEDTDWTPEFVNFLEAEDFRFDDLLVFMRGTIWQRAELKDQLSQSQISVIEGIKTSHQCLEIIWHRRRP